MPRIIDAFAQFFDDNGDPLVNGFLAFKESGTNNTDKDTFADINEDIANANPVPLDGAGRCPNVFGTGAYNAISYAEDANNPGNPGQQIQQFDPVNIAATEGQFSDWNSSTTYNVGGLVIALDGNYYRSLINNNENQDPTTSAGQWEEIKFVGVWNINVTYDSGDSVYGSDGVLYLSLTASNIANNPTTDTLNWKSYMDNNSPDVLSNIGFTATVATKALTFDLKTRNLIDPTAADKVRVAFRSETLTAGDYDVVEAGAALTVVVPDGATLGFAAAEAGFIYLYGINNSGAIEFAVSGTLLDETILHTTVAIDAAADTRDALYSTTLRSNIPIRLLGKVKITTGVVAGEWDNAPTELYVGQEKTDPIQLCKAWVNFNGTGTVAIRDSYNVSSITDNGTGDYTINFTNAMSDANYAAVATNNLSNSVSSISDAVATYATTSVDYKLFLSTSPIDISIINIAIFGN